MTVSPRCFFYLLCSFVLVSASAQARLSPDKAYYVAINAIDSITPVSLIRDYRKNKAAVAQKTTSLLQLSKTYRLNIRDMYHLLDLALISQNPDAARVAIQASIMVNALPVKELLQGRKAFVKEVYRIDVDSQALSADMQRVMADFLLQEDRLIKEARMHLDPIAVSLVSELWARDNQVRKLQGFVFKDTDAFSFRSMQYNSREGYPMGRWIAFEMADSLNFSKLYKYLQNHPYPGETIAGDWSGRLWEVVRHAIGLLYSEDKPKLEHYVSQWKFILPIVYKASHSGDIAPHHYAWVHQAIIEAVNKNSLVTDKNYFLQFSPEKS